MWVVEKLRLGVIVVAEKIPPCIYVYGPAINDGPSYDHRWQIAEQIRDYLNGGERPGWLDGLWRRGADYARGIDDTEIMAVGPAVDWNPPHCCWGTDMSEEAKGDRKRLMDKLILPETKP